MTMRATSSRKLAVVLLAGFLLLMLPATGDACRLYGVIGNDLPAGLLQFHLITAPKSLEELSKSQLDGWGIAYYPQYGDNPTIVRSAIRAYNDTLYDTTVADINSSTPQITVAHIRTCSSGCCSHGTDTIPDPHPFYRVKNGKTWVFVHNGGVSKSRMTTLIGPAYLHDNPPNGSDIDACDPSNPDMVVDSELYFLFVLKKIEEKSWNVPVGIAAAIRAMVTAEETGAINFILSDGEALWAFRRGGSSYTLYYLHDETSGYSVVASQHPSSSQDSWVLMESYQLAILTRDAAPVVINNVMNYCPGDLPADFNGDGQVNATDAAAFALNFGRSGTGDLDADGDVDGSDLAAMIKAYGRRCP